jgi:predicted nucleic acid-binding OB-fold protein
VNVSTLKNKATQDLQWIQNAFVVVLNSAKPIAFRLHAKKLPADMATNALTALAQPSTPVGRSLAIRS